MRKEETAESTIQHKSDASICSYHINKICGTKLLRYATTREFNTLTWRVALTLNFQVVTHSKYSQTAVEILEESASEGLKRSHQKNN